MAMMQRRFPVVPKPCVPKHEQVPRVWQKNNWREEKVPPRAHARDERLDLKIEHCGMRREKNAAQQKPGGGEPDAAPPKPSAGFFGVKPDREAEPEQDDGIEQRNRHH